jgi:hypothetical protein
MAVIQKVIRLSASGAEVTTVFKVVGDTGESSLAVLLRQPA